MPFATVEDVATYIKQNLTAADAATVSFLLDQVTKTIQNRTGQTITQVAGDVITLSPRGHSILVLPEVPVTAVASVVVEGVTQVADTDYTWESYGLLFRPVGRTWGSKRRSVVVTYTHGYATIQDDLKMATCELVSRAFQSGAGPNVAAISESLESGYSRTERYVSNGSTPNLIDPAEIIKRYTPVRVG